MTVEVDKRQSGPPSTGPVSPGRDLPAAPVLPSLPSIESLREQLDQHRSMWGQEVPLVTEAVSCLRAGGQWLNLCAGDGRYSRLLLERAASLLAFDIDQLALARLENGAPPALKTKLKTQQCDVTKPLPLADESVEAVLCTGALHLFPPHQVRAICGEMKRVLKPDGDLLVDFSWEIARRLPDGSLHTFPNEHCYTAGEAEQLLREALRPMSCSFFFGEAPPMQVTLPNVSYEYSSKGCVVLGRKPALSPEPV